MILGIDPGQRRVGLALADGETRFARPLEVVERDPEETEELVKRISEVVAEHEVHLVVVGKPLTLRGEEGHAVSGTGGFLERLRAVLDVPVVDYDERLSTVIADQGMRAGGASREARKKIRDAVAAQVMLQGFIDSGGDREWR